MSRITSLLLSNFKRQNVTETLTGKDIFVGPNGVGKSSRIQALQVAILGYSPEAQGKKAEHTFELATGDEMIVGLGTENFSFNRTFKKNTKVKRETGAKEVTISQSITVSPSRGEKTVTEGEARIAAELGNFPVMLDFDSFLNLSDAERRKFFYTLAGVNGDAWTKETVRSTLRAKLLNDELEENNPDAYKTRETMIDTALNEWRAGLDAEQAVQAMYEWAKAEQKHWNSEKTNAAGAVRQLAELKNNLEETDRSLNENRAELERLQKELTDVTAEISRQQEAKKAIDNRIARIEEIENEIKKLEHPGTVSRSTGDIKAEIEELRSTIVDVNVDAELSEIDSRDKVKRAILETVINELLEAQKNLTDGQTRQESLKRTIDQASDRGGICVIASNISCPKDFTPFVDWSKQQFEEAENKVREAQTRVEELHAQREQLHSELNGFQVERAKVHEKARETMKSNEHTRRNMQQLENWVQSLENEEKARQDKIAFYRDELTRLNNETVEAIAVPEILWKQRDGLILNIENLKLKIQEQDKARTTIQNMKASMIDSETAENKHAATKYIAEELGPKGIQGEMLVGALSPIENQVTENLKAMGIQHPFFFRTNSARGQEVFRFGWRDDEYEVEFKALSTGQQMILLIALLVTILERANPACKILAIDKFEHLDDANMSAVLVGLNAVSDKLDNIIITSAKSIPEIDGWNIRRLGGGSGTN